MKLFVNHIFFKKRIDFRNLIHTHSNKILKKSRVLGITGTTNRGHTPAALSCCPGEEGWPSAVLQTATCGWTNSRLAKNKTIEPQDKQQKTKTKPRMAGVEEDSGSRNNRAGSNSFQDSPQGRPQEWNGELGFPSKTPLYMFLKMLLLLVFIFYFKNLA